MSQTSKLLIVGVGLIGGSVGLALKAARAPFEIIGHDRDEAALRRAVARGAVDRYALDIGAAVVDADIVMLALPMQAMTAALEQLRPHLRADTIVTDTGSVKSSFLASAAQVFGNSGPLASGLLVPGHPISGRESSGIEAACAELYQSRRVILTPPDEVCQRALECVRQLWVECGAEVEILGAHEHDQVLAAVSHLPHVLAYALMDTLIHRLGRETLFRYAAGGFRDFSRIASSDPTMWRDICLSNRDNLLAVIEQLQDTLQGLHQQIAASDGDGLFSTFARCKQTRDDHYE